MENQALRDTFGEFLINVGRKNDKIVVLDCDLSSSTRTNKFAKAFPQRFFNMGIAEQNMVGVALGLAISGKIPVISGFSIFTTGRAWEFIRLACHDNLNLKIITTHGGVVGEDGSTHNALEDLSLMASLPNLRILVPSDSIELLKILDYSMNTFGPFYIRLPRGSFPIIHKNDYSFSIGDPDVIKEGEDYGIIGNGYGTVLGVKYATKLENELNCSIKLINFPTIKPINQKRLQGELKSLKGVIIIEEHNIYCGFGSILARILAESDLTMKFIGIENSFGSSGSREDILNFLGLNYENIKKNLLELIKSF
ncbi:MAG: transketolase family protein [Candidatus Heimdallarchaeota archaeon]